MDVKQLTNPIRNQNRMEKFVLREIVTQIIYFIMGIIVSRGAVLGNYSPFGVSLAAAVPYRNMIMSIIGASVGYILLSPVDGFRYMAILVAVGAMRWLLNDITRINRSKFFAPLIAFLPVIATGIALINVSTSENSDLAACIIEGILAGSAAFFIKEAILMSLSNRPLTSFSQQESACLVMSACILLLSAGSLTFAGISAGRILAVCVILLCAKYGSVSGGSIASVAAGVVFGLRSSDFSFVCGCYGFGGLMAGLFAPMGKAATAAAFFICDAVMAFGADRAELSYGVIAESIIGIALFLLIPKNVGNTVSAVFLNSEDKCRSEAFKRALISRLNFASNALTDVTDCVNGVSRKLKEMYNPEIDWVYRRAADKTCAKCGLKAFCWESRKEITTDDFNRLSDTLKTNGFITENDIEGLFVKKCCKQREIAQSVTDSYKEFLSCEEAQRRITQVRSVVAGQFSGLSEILKGLAYEFDGYTGYDTESSERICAAFKEIGLTVINCSCPVNSKNVMTVEIEAVADRNKKIMKSEALGAVCNSCGRLFDSPCISYAGDKVRLIFNQRTIYDIEIGSCQHICRNAELCGDSMTYFSNGMGDFVAMISDGMGTGGRAAVDSNMATSIMSKLCKAGLTYDCALQIVNSALMVKSEDESLATVDLMSLDLFSGRAKIMKAGAVVTYFKKNSKILRKDMPSLPVGILNEVQFITDDVVLTSGDLIVMISDGAVFNDDKWLENLIKSWDNASTQELAEAVVDEAIKRRSDSHDDDITAIAMRIVES